MPIVPGSNPALQTWNGQRFVVADGSITNPIILPFLQVNGGQPSSLVGSNPQAQISYYSPANLTVGLATNATTATTSINIAGGASGEIPYQTTSGTTGFTSIGTNGQVLTSTGGGTPIWTNAPAATTAQAISGGSAGQVIYQSAVDTTSFVSVGSSGQVLVSNGTSSPFWSTNISGNAATATTATTATGVATASVTSAGLAQYVGANTWVVKSSAYTALAGDRVATNTSGGAWTLTLPTSPATNTMVTVADNEHNWSVNNLTVSPGGSNTIEGSVQNLICDASGYSFYLLYNGTTWRVLV